MAEYGVEERYFGRPSELAILLNNYSEEGWDVVSVSSTGHNRVLIIVRRAK